MADCGQPRFRAGQLIEWLYGKGTESYEAMTNLPAALRERLEHEAPLSVPQIADKQVSSDGTRKYVLRLADGALVETVGIPSRDVAASGQPRRLTVCFSTQVGCPMGCVFCATGREGFTRNLEPAEMVWQLLAVGKDFGSRVSNAVAMGQGEPFLNYVNLLDALRIINHPKALGIGARHITVSTCGVREGILRFGEEPEQFTLALSLHAATQSTRDMIMPGMRNTPLADVRDALQVYITSSGRRVSLEYLLFDGVNDSDGDLDALVAFCRGLNAHVNLLPVNRVEGSSLLPSPASKLNVWANTLGEHGIEASVRDSRGGDIDAACGQLKNSVRMQP